MIEKQKMSSMDCDSPIAEPPRKISKTTSSYNTSRSKAHPDSTASSPNILQKIKYTIALDASENRPKSHLLYQEVDDNLTVFDLDGKEFVAVNVPLNEISQLPPQRIPYTQFWVENFSERRHAIIRAGKCWHRCTI